MNLPAWDLESEYPSLTSSEFLADESRFAALTSELSERTEGLRPQLNAPASPQTIEALQKILLLNLEAGTLIWNLMTYISCIRSTDAKNEEAKSKQSQLQSLNSQYNQTFKPIHLFLSTCEDSVIDKVLLHPELKGSVFTWSQERKLKDTLLSEKEEKMLAALQTDGFDSWGQLYNSLSGTMRVTVELNGQKQEMGLAQASGMTRNADESERKAAWMGIQKAWKENEESAAAILNSLAGWRLETYQKRSHQQHVDFMTFPLAQSRIQKETLNAMMTAVENNKKDIQKAALLMAKMLGKIKLDPWDTLAPAPIPRASSATDFETGLAQIRSAFAGVHSEFGEFVDLMSRNRWIEARVLPNKSNGAYCTGFVKSRTPRVFQTYLGSNKDISTLAHELGHAYH